VALAAYYRVEFISNAFGGAHLLRIPRRGSVLLYPKYTGAIAVSNQEAVHTCPHLVAWMCEACGVGHSAHSVGFTVRCVFVHTVRECVIPGSAWPTTKKPIIVTLGRSQLV
jgi:hypothetical protein